MHFLIQREQKLFIACGAFIAVLLSLLFIFGAIIILGYLIHSYVGLSHEVQEFVVREGEGLGEIAHDLKAQGLIRSTFAFTLYVTNRRGPGQLKAGNYLLTPSMKTYEIADAILGGRVVPADVRVTIPEGFTLRDIEERLQSSNLEYRISNIMVGEYQEQYTFLKDVPSEATLEGFLFPDTYFFDEDVAAYDIAGKMLDNFGSKLTEEMRVEITREQKTVFAIITMASLIEKEVRTIEDKRIVSGVLWKRLRIGMPFQVDATITYITGKRTSELTLTDLATPSPYNTYLNRGLPPGPIASPGLESIEAAILPQSSDYLYYLSKPDGTTVFSRTLEEHNRAKRLYLEE